MKKIFATTLCLFAIASCKGDNKASNVEEMLLTTTTIASMTDVRIMGHVSCKSCKPKHSMTVEVWESDVDFPELLNDPPWMGDFDEGNFSIDIKAQNGRELAVKAYIFSTVMKGPGIAKVTVPAEGENHVIPGIEIDIGY